MALAMLPLITSCAVVSRDLGSFNTAKMFGEISYLRIRCPALGKPDPLTTLFA